MSKMRLVIMSALLMLLLVACGGSAPEPATEEAEPTQVQEAEPTAVPEEEAEPTAEPVEEEPEPTAEPVEEEPEPTAEPAEEEDASDEGAAEGEKVTLTIESWRNDDLAIWQDTIIPAFNAEYPNIEVLFAPTAPTEYDGVLNTKLEGGTAGDLITCRPFDRSLALFDAGHLASLNELDGLGNFGDVAKSAWVTDDGGDVFCMPMASVIHGFIYNADIFAELGLSEPTTEAEFYALLDAIKADGSYTAL
ncbi:MAG: ABC transporter substrate-binding protein, partial [Ardenticatenaceae bacterium]